MVSNAGIRAGRLARGSPIPMNTKLSILRPASFLAKRICPTISPVDKFLFSPSSPLAQNLQPRAQPTCVDTQRVSLEALTPLVPSVARIKTLSINC